MFQNISYLIAVCVLVFSSVHLEAQEDFFIKGLDDAPVIEQEVFILADRSNSMSGEKIQELNAAIEQSFEDLKRDPVASTSIRVSVIAFDSNVETVLRLTPVSQLGAAPRLQASGNTNMADALNTCMQQASPNMKMPPIVILITDGMPSDKQAALESAQRLMNQPANFHAIGVSGSDEDYLEQLADGGYAMLRGTQFKGFFDDFSSSVCTYVKKMKQFENGIVYKGDGSAPEKPTFSISNKNNWKK